MRIETCTCTRCRRDRAFLRRDKRPPAAPLAEPPVHVVDLFAGCGGMTCGIQEAARQSKRRVRIELAVELDPRIARIYKQNFSHSRVVATDVATMLPGDPGDEFSAGEHRLATGINEPDFLVAGPPCQGHSDLNNHTRREDPKNGLYLKVARAAEVMRPRVVVIENVPAVQHDRGGVVETTTKALCNLGYSVDSCVLDLANVGVSQHRLRFVLIASRSNAVSPAEVFSSLDERWSNHPTRSVDWAFRDLERYASPDIIDSRTSLSPESVRRINYLFDNKLYDLPDSERPPCHRDKAHSYGSVYGRLAWSKPSQTITSGFGTMGQGRYVHPSQRRTLTPHEAARLQGFPDWFAWGQSQRSMLATVIGNAVPPQLMLQIGSIVLPLLAAEN